MTENSQEIKEIKLMIFDTETHSRIIYAQLLEESCLTRNQDLKLKDNKHMSKNTQQGKTVTPIIK